MLLAGKFVRLDFIHRHMRCHSISKLEMLFILALIAGFLRPSHGTAVVDFKTDDRI